jgi:prepilin-type N-terminal cleavage/methylation domain-containing protein/prepilin-type processing-associated H-X9-DG protein
MQSKVIPKNAATNRPAATRRGFTLVELLTVMAILGVLAGILIPTVGKVMDTARANQCISNLRQLHAAIQLHANDNQGYFPGPVWTNQEYRYNQYTRGQLSKILTPYLPAVAVEGGQFSNEAFRCSAWAATEATSNSSLVLNINPWSDGLRPFGQSRNPEENSIPPAKFLTISTQPISRTWMITDQDNPIMVELGWASSANRPQNTIHGNSRNVLFYDGHVQKIPTSRRLSSLLNP